MFQCVNIDSTCTHKIAHNSTSFLHLLACSNIISGMNGNAVHASHVRKCYYMSSMFFLIRSVCETQADE